MGGNLKKPQFEYTVTVAPADRFELWHWAYGHWGQSSNGFVEQQITRIESDLDAGIQHRWCCLTVTCKETRSGISYQDTWGNKFFDEPDDHEELEECVAGMKLVARAGVVEMIREARRIDWEIDADE